MKRWKVVRRAGWLRDVLAVGLAFTLPLVVAVVGAGPMLMADSLGLGELGMAAAALLAVAAVIGGAVILARGVGRALRQLDAHRGSFEEVAIGAEGVRAIGLSDATVVRWRDVMRVSATEGDEPVLTAHMDDGRRIRWSVAEPLEFVAAARAAFARFRACSPAETPAELETPSGDVMAWLGTLRALLAASNYRDKAITPEALASVAEDPTAAPLTRVGSVAALARADDAIKARVRVAIDEIADPELAELMTEALDGTVSPDRVARVAERG